MAKEITAISTDIMQGFSKKYIDAMQATFRKYGIWKSMFSVGANADEATCMLYHNGKWEVFFSEKNKKIELEQFDDEGISDACIAMIRRVPEEKENVAEMEKYYRSLLEKNTKLGFRAKDIEKIITKALSTASML